jgi:hypothetical protein
MLCRRRKRVEGLQPPPLTPQKREISEKDATPMSRRAPFGATGDKVLRAIVRLNGKRPAKGRSGEKQGASDHVGCDGNGESP